MRGAAPVFREHERCVFSEEAVRVVAQRVCGVPVSRAELDVPGPWPRGACVRAVTGYVALRRELVKRTTDLSEMPHVYRVHTSTTLLAAAQQPEDAPGDAEELVLDTRIFGSCPVVKTTTAHWRACRGATRDRGGAAAAHPTGASTVLSNVVLVVRLVAEPDGTALPGVCAVATRDIPDARTPLVVAAEAPLGPPTAPHCTGRGTHARIDLALLIEAFAQTRLQELPFLCPASSLQALEQEQQHEEEEEEEETEATTVTTGTVTTGTGATGTATTSTPFLSPPKITAVREEMEALGAVRISVDRLPRYPVCYDEPIPSLALVAEHDADLAPHLDKLATIGSDLVCLAVTTGVDPATQQHAQLRCSDGTGLQAWLYALRTTLRSATLEDLACPALTDALVACTALQELALVRCRLGPGGLRGLPRALLALDVSGSDWDGAGVGEHELPRLEELVAVGCTHIDPARLAQSLRGRRTLRRADFAWCTGLACSALADALADVTAIETLSVAHCRNDHPPAPLCRAPGVYPAWCATIRTLDTAGIDTTSPAFTAFLQHCPLLQGATTTSTAGQ